MQAGYAQPVQYSFQLDFMPFICIYQLNNGAITESDEVIFIKFIDSSFGEFHQEKVKIAQVTFNGNPAFIYSNCPSFPSAKSTLKKGDKITAETKIAFFSANGEDIPCARPYAIIIFE